MHSWHIAEGDSRPIWQDPGEMTRSQRLIVPPSRRRGDSGLKEAGIFLRSRLTEIQERIQRTEPDSPSKSVNDDPRKVFVVHGHNDGLKQTVARLLQQLRLEPIILHAQPNKGATIIDKFESNAMGVASAIVLLTADDIAYDKNAPDKTEHRACQNVVLELGFFLGRLGRTHTFALVEQGVTLPSDFGGVIHIGLGDEPSVRPGKPANRGACLQSKRKNLSLVNFDQSQLLGCSQRESRRPLRPLAAQGRSTHIPSDMLCSCAGVQLRPRY